MEVNKTVNGNECVCKVNGRVDTTTAPQLEKELNDGIENIQQLILDLENVEYISSAGLRVLLATQKIMNKQGKMIVKNVNEMVMEIFEMTGFVDMLTIE